MARARRMSTNSARDLKTAEQLGRIEGKIDSFTTNFARHEISDAEFHRQTDARLERQESRSSDRAAAMSAAFETRMEKMSQDMKAQFDAFSDKLEAITQQQSFSKGGWRYLTIVGGVVLSLLTSIGSYIADHWK